MATVGQRRLPLERVGGLPRLGRLGWLAVIVALMAALFALFRGDMPWPAGLTYALDERLDSVYNWIVDNQDSTWVFVYVLHPIADALDWLVTSLSDLLVGLTWVGVTFAGTALTWRFGGWRAAVVVLASCAGFGLLGLWSESMETLALIIASVLVALLVGIPLGVAAGLNDRFQRAITPVLDAMQIIPAFAYLMPVVILFSVGAPAAVIATVIYAVPPAVRITALGIRGVPRAAVESTASLGSTRSQTLRKVQLPLARRTIMLGVNQTIMMALSIVIIASLIGGGGLGDVVISALTYLDVGGAMIAGAAIVIMAIALDRSTAAAAARLDPTNHAVPRTGTRRQAVLLSLGVLAACAVIALVARAAGAGDFPDVSIAGTPVAERLTSWINSVISWVQDPAEPIYPITSWMGDAIVTYLLEPLRIFLAESPWWAIVGGVTAIALVLHGVRAAVTVAVALAAIGVMGVWDDAMSTASQVLVATALTLAIGFAVGVWAAESPRVERALRPMLDALQTLPQFVYLIPVVALFNVGRVPGVVASVLYAIPVVIRLTITGLREVPHTTVEAAEAFGASRLQVLRKVKIPLARPALLLATNQGIIMVLAVVIVAGLVGGGALGYGVVVGLQRNEFGAGMVASLAILALGIVLDRLTQPGRGAHAEQHP